MRYVMLVVLVVVATGCADKGRCLSSHEETMLIPVYGQMCNGNSCTPYLMTMIPTPITVCDKWEYPDGKPVEQKQ